VKHSKSSSSSLAVPKSMKKSRSKDSVPGLFEQPEILKSIRPTITPKARLSSVVPMSGPGASVTIKPKGLDDTIPEVSMLVLYGSNSGTALDIAHRLAKSGESVLNGLEISDIKPLDFCTIILCIQSLEMQESSTLLFDCRLLVFVEPASDLGLLFVLFRCG
jgi:sulfite reductase alpha subunit-like flavoprotein